MISMASVLREAFDSALLDVHVAMPGKVVTYDSSRCVVDVLPMIRRAVQDRHGEVQHEDLPVIPNVPVAFGRGGGFSFTWPLNKGDFVLLVFNSSAIAAWREAGDVSDPVDLRRHDLSYPVAFPCISPDADVPPTESNAARLEVSGNTTHVQVGDSTAQAVALDALIQQRFGELFDAISSAGLGSADGGTLFKSNLIAALGTAGWSSAGATSTACSKLKAQ